MRSATAMRPEAGRIITVNSAIRPSAPGLRRSRPLQRAVAGPRLEDQGVDVVACELVGVAEVLEDAEDRPDDGLDGLAALVGPEHRRAAEDDVVGEQRERRVDVGALDRGAKGVAVHRVRQAIRYIAADVRPAYVTPMKAVLTAERPAGAEWVFERKLDGIRCLAVKDGGRTRLYSRNELSMNDRYPALVAALDDDPAEGFVIDGEAVSFVGGRDRFGGGEGGQLFYYVFDVLFAGGRDVRSLPLEERRRVLEGVLRWSDPLRMTEQVTGDGAELLARACGEGWEGLIAKRLGTPYVSARSRDWLKLKCTRAQELVIGGFTAPRGSRTDLGALLVGHFDGDRLRYAGKVGTGFTRATLRELSERLAPLVRETSPFEPEKGIPRAATWVEPELVAQIAFMEWTPDGRLRHPSFLGVRFDKPAREVVREEPSA
jgi:bifunctional non-homologous end joining protein LigD